MGAAAQSGHPDPALPVLPLLILAAALAVYLVGAVGRRTAGRWSPWRSASFAAGLGLIVAALLPPLAAWAHHDLRGHMLQHLLLGMFAPLGLVLGAPGTLLLRSLPVRAARALVALLGTRAVHALVHPLVALVLDIGGMYLLYLTPLYALASGSPLAHGLMHVHFLISGCLFTWAIAGPDPAPRRPGLGIRLAALFLATAAHATLGKLMYAHGFPRGTPYDDEQIRTAAQLMYYGGDLAELLLAIAFFAVWTGQRRRRSAVALPPVTVLR